MGVSHRSLVAVAVAVVAVLITVALALVQYYPQYWSVPNIGHSGVILRQTGKISRVYMNTL